MYPFVHDEQVRSGEVTQTHSLQRGREPYLRATHYTYSPGETQIVFRFFNCARSPVSHTITTNYGSFHGSYRSVHGRCMTASFMEASFHGSFIFDRYDLHPVCGTPPLTTALVVGWPRLRVRVRIGESGWGVCACIGGDTCAKHWGTEKTFQRSIDRV